MAYDDDYTPVLPDEEEQQKLGAVAGYPGVTPPPSAPPVQPAAIGYAPAGTADLESRLTAPRESMQESVAGSAPAPVRPQWKDYAPAEPTTTAGKVGKFFGNMLYPYRQYEAGKEKTAEENYKNAVGEYEAPGKEAQQQATTEQAQSAAERNRAEVDALRHPQPKPKEEEWQNVPTLAGPNGEPVEYEKNSGQYRYGQLPGAKQSKTPTETQEQNKLGFQSVLQKVDQAGLSTDPKHLDASLDQALHRGIITKDEHAQARGYQGANPTPATNLAVHIEGVQGTEGTELDKAFTGKEVVAHLPGGRRVQMSYGEAKKQGIPLDQMTVLAGKEAQDNRDRWASVSATMEQLKTYRNDFKNYKPTTQDEIALKTLATHQKETAGLIGGMLDDIPLVGKPIEAVNKLIAGTITQQNFDSMTPAGKKLIADYFSTIVGNFANMKATLGSVGRNPMQLEAEVSRVPLPYLGWEAASPMFDSTRDDIQRRSGSLPEIQ